MMVVKWIISEEFSHEINMLIKDLLRKQNNLQQKSSFYCRFGFLKEKTAIRAITGWSAAGIIALIVTTGLFSGLITDEIPFNEALSSTISADEAIADEIPFDKALSGTISADEVMTDETFPGETLSGTSILQKLVGTVAEPAFAAEGYDQTASAAQQASAKEVKKYGMIPIRAEDVNEGSYKIEAESSSSFFRIEKAVLKVKDGKMTVAVTLSSASYKFVYPGTAAEAAAAPLGDYIKLKEREGQGNFRMEISGLNEEIPCAAFSKKKKLWYDRTILFDAGSLPREALKISLPDYDKIEKAMDAYGAGASDGEGSGGAETGNSTAADSGGKDSGSAGTGGGAGTGSGSTGSGNSAGTNGKTALASFEPVSLDMEDGEYSIQVNMSGGSGRAGVTSPTWLIVKDGKAWAKLLWSSTYYDYMIVGGVKYLNETKDGGNSTFTIPIAVMDEDMPVIADTTAMGDPVEIEYQLTFYRDSIGSKRQIPQEAAMDVLAVALVIIVLGGILNFVIKKRRKQ